MLTFDPIPHEYRWQNAIVPSVTQIIRPIATDFGFVAPDVLERARQKGDAVALMMELDCARQLDEESLTGPLVGYFKQWRDFLRVTKFQVLHAELPLYSKLYGYAGKFDLFGVLESNEMVIDEKSGAVPKTARPQTAAYAQLIKEEGICAKPRRRVLDLKEDSWKLSDEYRDPGDLKVFLSCLTLHNFLRNS